VKPRDWHFMLAAAALHLALPVAAAIAPEHSLPHFIMATTARQAVEIDVDVSMLAPSQLDRAVTDRALPTATDRRLAYNPRHTQDSDLPRPPRPDDTSHPTAGPPEPILDAPDDADSQTDNDYYRPPSRTDIDAAGRDGVGYPPFWSSHPGALPDHPLQVLPAPTAAPRRRYDPERGTKVLRDGVRGHDRTLALDFPGATAIAAVLRDAVRASDAPFECSGRFGVTVNAAGRVSAIDLASYSGGDPKTWQAVRKSARAQLAGRVFPLKSSFARGAMVAVAVVSRMKMPGGGTGRDGATLRFDVSDIKARPTRVVSVSVHAQPIE